MSKPLAAIGLMSGTSLDGIDVAMLETDGEKVFRHGPSLTVPYTDDQRDLLRRALVDAATLSARSQRPGILHHVENSSTKWHADAVQQFVQKNGITLSNISVIGFHGQTVLHRPHARLTVQLGDGALLANLLSTPVVYDMRANDMEEGGQGAPLVPAYHRALAESVSGLPVCLVNIGGVSNITWIGRNESLIAFDTGPGNALIDDWMKKHTGTNRDENGQMGMVGQVDEATVARFFDDSYFSLKPPKSLDRNHFARVALEHLSLADGAATLAAVTARSIAAATQHLPEKPSRWIICGGGRYNKAIMRALQASLENVVPAENVQLRGDAIEAEAWAFLAVRSMRGLPLTYPGTTGVRRPVTGGLLARPD